MVCPRMLCCRSWYSNSGRLPPNKAVHSSFSSNISPVLPLFIRYDSRSFRKSEKRRGDRFSPCLTPIWLMKLGECSPFSETHDFMLLYILKIILKNLPFTPDSISFYINHPENRPPRDACECALFSRCQEPAVLHLHAVPSQTR